VTDDDSGAAGVGLGQNVSDRCHDPLTDDMPVLAGPTRSDEFPLQPGAV
jgi:hypothetical protein